MNKLFKKLRNPRVYRPVIGLAVIIIVMAITVNFLRVSNRIFIDNSLISGPITVLSPSVPGKIVSIEVTDGQKVKKGDAVATVGSEILRAYTDGIIIDTDKQIGSLASVQTAVVRMINLSDMRVDGTLDENKGLNQIKPGQAVSFTVDALPGQTFWGFVDEISQTARQTQISFSISSERPVQQFDVYAHFDASAYPQIKNGMSAKMTVFIATP